MTREFWRIVKPDGVQDQTYRFVRECGPAFAGGRATVRLVARIGGFWVLQITTTGDR